MPLQQELQGILLFLLGAVVLAMWAAVYYVVFIMVLNLLTVWVVLIFPYILDWFVWFWIPVIATVDYMLWDCVVFLFGGPNQTDAVGTCDGDSCVNGHYSHLGSWITGVSHTLTGFWMNFLNMFRSKPGAAFSAVDLYIRTRGGPVASGQVSLKELVYDGFLANLVRNWLPLPVRYLASAIWFWVEGAFRVLFALFYLHWFIISAPARAVWWALGLHPIVAHVLIVTVLVVATLLSILCFVVFVRITRLLIRLGRRLWNWSIPQLRLWWAEKVRRDQEIRDILSDAPVPGFVAYVLPQAPPVVPQEMHVVEGNAAYFGMGPGVPHAIVRIPPPAPPAPQGAVANSSRLNISVPAMMPVTPPMPKEEFSGQFAAGVLVRDWRCTKELVRILRVEKKACSANRSKDNIADAHDFLVRYCKERGYGKLANMRTADLDLVVPIAADIAYRPHATDLLIHVANQTVAVHEWSVRVRERLIARVLNAAGLPIWPLGQP